MLNHLNPHFRKTRLPFSKFRLIVSLTAGSCVLLSIVSPAQAGTIGDISPKVFGCMKTHNGNTQEYPNSEGYVNYIGGNTGTVQVYAKTLFGNVKVGSVNFAYKSRNSQPGTLTISNNETPITLSPPDFISRVESGMRATADWCRKRK